MFVFFSYLCKIFIIFTFHIINRSNTIMGHIYQTHEYKNERIRALSRRVEELEAGEQVKDLVAHCEFLEAQVEILHKDIANIHFNQTVGWTETNS